MKTLDGYNTKFAGARKEPRSAFFGLIGEADFYRPELYGFEVDLTGRVLIQEFRPDIANRPCRKALRDTAA